MKSARQFLFAICLLVCACERQISGPISQRGYLWQRDWTPATEEAFRTAQSRLDGVVNGI
jgi:hypothetical protein